MSYLSILAFKRNQGEEFDTFLQRKEERAKLR